MYEILRHIKFKAGISRLFAVKYLKLLCTLTGFILAGNLHAQAIFSDLTATQFGDSIFVNWTLKGGETCVNMHLQRSPDNIVFEDIFIVGGTCGAATDQYYDHYDAIELKNSITYYYRVTASNDFYISDTVHILYINAGDASIFVYPNPSDAEFNVTVDNLYIPPFLIQLYDIDSKQINYSQMIYANNFTMGKGVLASGVYLLKVTTEDRLVLTKQVVVGQ